MSARAGERGRTRHAPAWTLVMSVAASSLSFIDGSILNVALPAIRAGTGAAAAEVQWVVNGYTLPLAALILLGGALGDHHGRRLWLVIGVALFGDRLADLRAERLARNAARRPCASGHRRRPAPPQQPLPAERRL